MDVAVIGRHVCKSYGEIHAVQNLDIRVPSRSIYALLGPSGCGKTTLLRCMLSRLTPESGTIVVFGHVPNTRGSDIPGRGVGYVPQELALYREFNTREHLRYFGLLYGMSRKNVEERTKFLINLLELPDEKRLVRNLSGGQQRRVSLAVGLLHEPPLLILDEPTVGLDPLLRFKIWKYLQEVMSKSNTTIVITTHYIEEAMQAHLVGLMRDGDILAEAPPSSLIESYGLNTLEEVFLKLCRNVENDQFSESTVDRSIKETLSLSHRCLEVHKLETSMARNSLHDSEKASRRNYPKTNSLKSFVSNIGALMWKNFAKLFRKPGLLIFELLLPAFQISLFSVVIGQDPKGLSVATVNLDTGIEFYNFNLSLGNIFINCIASNDVSLKEYDSIAEAMDKAHSGDVWAVVIVPANFSMDTALRMRECSEAGNETLSESKIEIRMDETDLQIVVALKKVLNSAYSCFIHEAASRSPMFINPNSLSSLITYLNPVYGNVEDSYVDFVAPGMMINLAFCMPIALTSVIFVVERKEGLLERTWVAGVSPLQMLIAHAFTQLSVIASQMTLVVFIALVAFDIRNNGSVALVFSLTVLQGIAGMSLGLAISAFSTHEASTLQLSLGLFNPIFLLGGVVWPVEGMPKWLQDVSNTLPTTKATTALRSITQKGWDFTWDDVWEGYLVTIGWTICFLVVTAIGLRLRK